MILSRLPGKLSYQLHFSTARRTFLAIIWVKHKSFLGKSFILCKK
nr:MAG TPA: hypothetical protein [Caudoviricetes sp.]